MLPAQQREAVGRFEILLFWLQEHTKKYNQMIISSINEVKNISFTDLLHKIGKLVFKHVVSAYNWDVCKPFTARGVGLYQCQNWKSIEDIISIVHQAGTRVCLGIFDRKRREEDIFMCSLNNVSCDRSDWDEPDKNSSEYNLRLCLWLLHFSSSQKKWCQKNATHARSQNTLHSHWPDMCPVPRSGPVP